MKYYYQTAAPDLGHLTYNITNELLIHSQYKVERKKLYRKKLIDVIEQKTLELIEKE